MPDPYTAVGLIPTVRGVRKRAEIQRNLEHISHLIAAATWLSSLDLPVRLVLLPEGALLNGRYVVHGVVQHSPTVNLYRAHAWQAQRCPACGAIAALGEASCARCSAELTGQIRIHKI